MQGVNQWVGIDVSKRWLDVHLRPEGKSFRVSTITNGIYYADLFQVNIYFPCQYN
jgi:transposase